MTEPKYPNVTVQLSGQDGNAFFMIGRTANALRKAGATPDEVKQFTEEATSGDYNNVISTIGKWVEVQ